MLGMKQKLLEDLIGKLSEMDDPLMEMLGGEEKPKVEAEPKEESDLGMESEDGESESEAELSPELLKKLVAKKHLGGY